MICSPPDAVPLRFGENSYFPHLEAARRCGIEPTVIRQPGIAMDIDHPVDLAASCACRNRPARARAPFSRGGVPLKRPDPRLRRRAEWEPPYAMEL